MMPVPPETLVYVARLSKNEAAAIRSTLDPAFASANLENLLDGAIVDVCLDRLVLAERLFEVASTFAKMADEEMLRTAVNRAYYSLHHSLRAIVLWRKRWDPDGHEESIKQFKELLSDNTFCGLYGLASTDWEGVSQARMNRHVADYSPYDRQRGDRGIETITDNDWQKAADFNVVWANNVLKAGIRVIES